MSCKFNEILKPKWLPSLLLRGRGQPHHISINIFKHATDFLYISDRQHLRRGDSLSDFLDEILLKVTHGHRGELVNIHMLGGGHGG